VLKSNNYLQLFHQCIKLHQSNSTLLQRTAFFSFRTVNKIHWDHTVMLVILDSHETATGTATAL